MTTISVLGLGYVGCVSAGCLAQDGFQAVGVDVNPQKVSQIQAGRSPIREPGLGEVIEEVVRSGRLRATLDIHAAVLESDVSMICVGTPSNGNGSLDTQHVEKVCREIGAGLAAKQDYHVVVIRSTVLPTTVQKKLIPILEAVSNRQAGVDFGVCMNPEFMRESCAIEDYYRPSYIVIGELDQRSGDLIESLYKAVEAPVVRTSIQTAEMVKYASNAFHALKITFANEIGNLCKAHGIDGQEMMEIFVQDKQLNISPNYLRPGFAFGGSCLPKDLRAVLYRAKERDLMLPLLNAVIDSNARQIQRAIEMVEQTGCKRVGILGLSFKAGTDDVRESPVVPLVETLVGRGYQVSIYDEKVDPEALIGTNKAFLERELPHIASIMRSSIEEVISEAEVVILTNGSTEFREAPRLIRGNQVLIDLVGIAKSNRAEVEYNGICW